MKQSYGPVPLNWRGYDLFVLEINFAIMLFFAYPSDIVIITLKFLLKWATKICGLFEAGHGMKKVEKHWSSLNIDSCFKM